MQPLPSAALHRQITKPYRYHPSTQQNPDNDLSPFPLKGGREGTLGGRGFRTGWVTGGGGAKV